MKILFLSTNDSLGGAAAVTLRLVEALRARGTDARMLVARADSSHPFVARVSPALRLAAKVAERVEILASNGFSRSDLWSVSSGRFGVPVARHPWVREADVVVLGWINQGLLSLAGLRALLRSGKKVVWWMHDYWCATGICHSPASCSRFTQGCGFCPHLHSRASESDLSRRVFRQKEELYGDFPGIRFLAVSDAQRRLILGSSLAPLMGNLEVLNHALPAQEFHTRPRTTRFEELHGRKLIVAGAANLADPLKNMEGAVRALNLLADSHPMIADECTAVFFGDTRGSRIFNSLRMPARLTGPLSAAELRELYASASVVFSPSLSETMGATLIEGLASGAVAVSYDSGGPADIITSPLLGRLVPLGDEQALAEAIYSAFIQAETEGADGRLARHRAMEERFSPSAIASRFLSLL